MQVVSLFDVAPELAREETRTLERGSEDDRAESLVFLECYCPDPDCDCRRVAINIVDPSSGEQLATLHHALDPPGERTNVHDPAMTEKTRLDPNARQSEEAEELKGRFHDIASFPRYADDLERHYRAVKEADTSDLERAKPFELNRKVAEVDEALLEDETRRTNAEGRVLLDDEEVERAAKERQKKKRTVPRSVRKRAGKAKKVSRYRAEHSLINAEWRKASLAQIIVVRRMPDDAYAGLFAIVDLGCLGLKDHFLEFGLDERMVHDQIQRVYDEGMEPTECSADLAARILHHAVTWSEQAGLETPEDFFIVDAFLGGTDPFGIDEPIPLGRGGKPFYMPGPNDDSEEIREALEEELGPEGYHYAMPSNERGEPLPPDQFPS